MHPNELPPDVETDERFPSGPWLGFFLDQRLRDKAWMELDLAFRHNRIVGEGRDRVGKFVVGGQYNVDDGTCRIRKTYLGRHGVQYEGYNEGKGIWGVWSIPADSLRGGFHIWPKGMGGGVGSDLDEEADLPADAAPALVGAGMAAEGDELP